MCVYVCVIFIINFHTNLITEGQPNLTSWSLDLDNNTIILHFTGLNSSNDGMAIDCTAILIGPVEGDINVAIRLLPSVVGLQVDMTMAICDLGMEFRSILDDTSNLSNTTTNLFLYYDSSEASGLGSLLYDYFGMVYENTMGTPAAEIVPDSNPPAIMSFELLDLNDGTLVISFSQPINITTLNFDNLSLQSSPFNDKITVVVPLSDGSCNNGCNTGRNVTLSLEPSDLDRLKLENSVCTYISNCYLYHTDTFIKDFGGNTIAKHNYCIDYFLKNLTLDTIPPSLTTCGLDLSWNTLSLEFDEPIDVTSFNPSGINISNFNLTSASVTESSSGSIIVIHLGLDADKIKLSLSIENYDISVTLISLAFKDIAGNSIRPISMPCTLINDTITPNMSSFILDLNSNLLQVIFDEPILVKHMNISGFKLTNVMGVTLVSLSDSKLIDFDDVDFTSVCECLYDTDELRSLFIALENRSLTAVKTNNRFGTTAYLTYLLIDQNSVYDLSNNGIISTGPIAAAVIIEDNSPTTLIKFSLDMNIGRLILTFNDVVDVSTLRLFEIFIQRAALSYSARYRPLGYSSTMDLNTVQIDLSSFGLIQLKGYLLSGLAIDINSTYLIISDTAIDDYRGNCIIAITNGNGIMASNYIKDSEPPVLTSFYLDMNRGQIELTFDEPISRINVTLFSIQADSMSIMNASSISFFNGGAYLQRNYTTRFRYQLTNSLWNLLQSVAHNASTANLVIMKGGAFDASENPINTTGPIHGRYIPKIRK